MHTGQYWNDRYISKETGWDLGKVSPPLQQYFSGIQDKGIRILIPGAGNAYEAIYLLENGFTNVTVIDIAINPIKRLQEKLSDKFPSQATIIHGDFFELKEKFDLIVEQTFLCALPPNYREKYASQMRNLLAEKGRLVGVLFNESVSGEPPYTADFKTYNNLFEQYFSIHKLESCHNSVAPRQGNELFINLGLKSED